MSTLSPELAKSIEQSREESPPESRIEVPPPDPRGMVGHMRVPKTGHEPEESVTRQPVVETPLPSSAPMIYPSKPPKIKVQITKPRQEPMGLEAITEHLEASLEALEAEIKPVLEKLNALETEAGKVRTVLARLDGPTAPPEQTFLQKILNPAPKHRVPKSRTAKRVKRAPTINPQVIAALKGGWRSIDDLVKTTGWKKASVQPQLSYLGKRVMKRPAPTEANPRKMEYRLKD